MKQKRKLISNHLKRARHVSRQKTDAAKERAKTLVAGEGPSEETPDRITNQTVEEHRKEVLQSAKRFVYPLSHSKHKIAIISAAIFATVVLSVVAVTSLMLYRYQRTDDFAYRIAQILPFPVARVDARFVSYKDYLFEVRQNVHFYTNQENINFEDQEGKSILANIREQSLQRVKEDALAVMLAKENNIEVTEEEIQKQITQFREQGGITSSEEAFESTLQEFYGWSIRDLEHVLELQLIKQKLVTVLDQGSLLEANRVLGLVKQPNADFAELASKYSQDTATKQNGGKLGTISRANADLPPQFLEAAFALNKGEVSDLVQTPFGYHIIKQLSTKSDDQIVAAHIFFRFTPVAEALSERLEALEVSDYITPKDDQEAPSGTDQSQPQQDDIR